jgi:hypothetical protein
VQTKSGLSDVERSGSAREGALLDDRNKIAQLADVHAGLHVFDMAPSSRNDFMYRLGFQNLSQHMNNVRSLRI